MRLTEARVRNFRNVIDSTPVVVEHDVTCLIGKNESGKTALLYALYLLNPARGNATLSITDHYPAWLEKRDRLAGRNLDEVRPIEAVFELEEDDHAVLTERFGKGAVASSRVTVQRAYNGRVFYSFHADEGQAVAHVVAQTQLARKYGGELARVGTFEALDRLIRSLQNRGGRDEAAAAAAASLTARRDAVLGTNSFQNAVAEVLAERLPKFFYFSEYSYMPGVVDLRRVLETEPSQLSEDEHNVAALLRVAAAGEEYLLNADYEVRKRELENTANAITTEVLTYWSQNRDLRVEIDVTQRRDGEAVRATQWPKTELHLRMRDDRRLLSLPFDERSSGFRWFFSFLAGLSEFELLQERVVILLDEPGRDLHASAQSDFLRFIEERLAPRHQVIYTTHSPFMVEPERLGAVRLVEDKGSDVGATVARDVLKVEADTSLPLRLAIAIDVGEDLFIYPHTLVVEAISDFTYLSILSEYLNEQGMVGLDAKWRIVPVGGAEHIATFLALATPASATIVVGARNRAHQRLQQLSMKGHLNDEAIVRVGNVLHRREADIEDLFAPEDYLVLYNRAFDSTVAGEEVIGDDPIVKRLAHRTGSEPFDRRKPADVLLRSRDEILPKLAFESLHQFEKLFRSINARLGA